MNRCPAGTEIRVKSAPCQRARRKPRQHGGREARKTLSVTLWRRAPQGCADIEVRSVFIPFLYRCGYNFLQGEKRWKGAGVMRSGRSKPGPAGTPRVPYWIAEDDGTREYSQGDSKDLSRLCEGGRKDLCDGPGRPSAQKTRHGCRGGLCRRSRPGRDFDPPFQLGAHLTQDPVD